MEIKKILSANFYTKAEKNNKQNKPQNKTNITKPHFGNKIPEIYKSYSLLDVNKGIKNATILPDYDGVQLTYKFKAPISGADKTKIIYYTNNPKETKEAFSSSKDIKTGEFHVSIPVLDRKSNHLIPKITIISVEYFDDANKKILNETPENMTIKPAEKVLLKEKRNIIINNKINPLEFDSISEGSVIGKLKEMSYDEIKKYDGDEPIIAVFKKDGSKESSAQTNKLFTDFTEGNFMLPLNIQGIIMTIPNFKQGNFFTDTFGHAVSRIRGRKIFALMDDKTYEIIKETNNKKSTYPYMKIQLDIETMDIKQLTKLPETDKTKINIPKYKFVNKVLLPEDNDFSEESVGLKAFNLGKLKNFQKQGNFKVPDFCVIPSGMLDEIKKAPENAKLYNTTNQNNENKSIYHCLINRIDSNKKIPEWELNLIRETIINGTTIPIDMQKEIEKTTNNFFDFTKGDKQDSCLIARSSFNGEDSDKIATQGLYDSFAGIRTIDELFLGIKKVWASKWSNLSYISRRDHNIPHNTIQPNVIIQKVVPVDYTFTINTADPRTNDKNKIVIQLSQGVYSGFTNTPYIFEYDKTTKKIDRKYLATKQRMKDIKKVKISDTFNNFYNTVDYSKDPLNMSKKHYIPVMKKVFEVAEFIENKFGGKPQDIEGGIIFKENVETGEMEPEIHIWQTRNVHLLKRT